MTTEVFQVPITTASITPMSKLLMGYTLNEVTTNLTVNDFTILNDELLKNKYDYTFIDLVDTILEHQVADDEVIRHIINNFPTSKDWNSLYGIEHDGQNDDEYYLKHYPEIRDLYKRKFRLAIEFQITPCFWYASVDISDDIERDLKVMIKITDMQNLAYIIQRYAVENSENIITKLCESVASNNRFGQWLKLTNPDLVDVINENWN